MLGTLTYLYIYIYKLQIGLVSYACHTCINESAECEASKASNAISIAQADKNERRQPTAKPLTLPLTHTQKFKWETYSWKRSEKKPNKQDEARDRKKRQERKKRKEDKSGQQTCG